MLEVKVDAIEAGLARPGCRSPPICSSILGLVWHFAVPCHGEQNNGSVVVRISECRGLRRSIEGKPLGASTSGPVEGEKTENMQVRIKIVLVKSSCNDYG